MHELFETDSIEKKLGVHFQRKDLLYTAFVHRSFWNENKQSVLEHNERLEFLGDSILGLLVADYLFQTYPHLDEGILSTLRSQMVDATACAHYVNFLKIESHLLLGKGEQLNRGKGRETILADLFEAIIGALYLDQGLEAARFFFLRHFEKDIVEQVAKPQRNWKAELQDWAQKNYQQTPIYQVSSESGPAHKKIFQVSVWIADEKQGEGVGFSKKEAQMLAAEHACLKMDVSKKND